MAKRAFLSVWDKTGIEEFAKELVGLGFGAKKEVCGRFFCHSRCIYCEAHSCCTIFLAIVAAVFFKAPGNIFFADTRFG